MLTSVFDIMRPLVDRMGLSSGLQLRKLQREWSEVVGPQIAMHSSPQTLQRGLLKLTVNHPIWKHQLSYFTPEILKKVNEAYPTLSLTGLRFYLDTSPRQSPPPSPIPPTFASTAPQESSPIEALLQALPDETLKQAIREALWAYNKGVPMGR